MSEVNHYNDLPHVQLIEHAVKRGEGLLTGTGALAVGLAGVRKNRQLIDLLSKIT